MIAKLRRAQSNAYQNKDKHRTPIMKSTLNNRSTTKESPPQKGQQPKQRGWGINAFLDHSNNFRLSILRTLNMKFDLHCGFKGDVWKCWRTDRRMEAGVICILVLAHIGVISFSMLKTLFYSTMYDMWLTLCQTCSLLRAIAGNTSHIKIFSIVCIQFVLCMDCQFMK